MRAFLRNPGVHPALAAFYWLALCVVSLAGIDTYANTSYWFDETYTGAVACQPDLHSTVALMRTDIHPVLHVVAVNLLFRLTGCHLWEVRAISLLATLAGTALLAWRGWKSGASLWVMAAIMAASPAFWYEAFEARVYALLFLCTCGIIACGLSRNANIRLLSVAFAMLGAMLHYFGCYLFAVAFGMWLLEKRPYGRKYMTLVALGLASAVILFYYYFQAINIIGTSAASLPWVKVPGLRKLFLNAPAYLFGSMLFYYIMGIFLVYGGFLVKYKSFLRKDIVVMFGLVAIFLILLFTVSQFRPVFDYHYTYFLFPCLLMGVSLCCSLVFDRLKTVDEAKGRKVLSGMIVALCLAMGVNAVRIEQQKGIVKSFAWRQASQMMHCTPAHPCAFLIDVPRQDLPDDARYSVIANFWAIPGNTLAAIAPEDLAAWLAAHPGGQFLWTSFMNPTFDIGALARKASLTCHDFLHKGENSIACIPNTAQDVR